jgi:hypothetical protein
LANLVQEHPPFLQIANLFLGGCETFGKVAFAKELPTVCQRLGLPNEIWQSLLRVLQELFRWVFRSLVWVPLWQSTLSFK